MQIKINSNYSTTSETADPSPSGRSPCPARRL